MIAIDRLRISTLMENTASDSGVVGEWGLSLFVETPDLKFLLDTGPSDSITRNIDAMRVDMSGVRTIVLSHGHYDHTGGLPAVLRRIGGPVRVIAHPEALRAMYGKNRETGEYKYAGVFYRTEFLENLGARFEFSASPTWLSEDIAASGEEPMETDFETVAGALCVPDPGGNGFVPDPMPDDQSVFMRTDRGLVVLLGCAHRGMINIIRYGRRLMGTDQVYLVLGGTHLGPASSAQLSRSIEELKGMDVQWIGVSHCTGQTAAAELKRAFGERFFFNNAGKILRFPLERKP
jgi:7,8-dihydropterin-6-yl-methyl-4-(beta-D-ribofuranosyl)aminobenzene 5'-phosphate synthase